MSGNVPHSGQKSNPAELFPRNVEELTAAGVEFHWRQSAADLFTACPLCAGKLAMHEEQPWALCLGDVHCRASALPFPELLTKMRASNCAARLDGDDGMATKSEAP